MIKTNLSSIDIANNIRAERNRKNLTTIDVANALSLSKPTYLKIENDAANAKIETLIKLSEVLNCKISDFFVK